MQVVFLLKSTRTFLSAVLQLCTVSASSAVWPILRSRTLWELVWFARVALYGIWVLPSSPKVSDGISGIVTS